MKMIIIFIGVMRKMKPIKFINKISKTKDDTEVLGR